MEKQQGPSSYALASATSSIAIYSLLTKNGHRRLGLGRSMFVLVYVFGSVCAWVGLCCCVGVCMGRSVFLGWCVYGLICVGVGVCMGWPVFRGTCFLSSGTCDWAGLCLCWPLFRVACVWVGLSLG